MSGVTYLGWDFQQMVLDEYRKGLAEAEPIGGLYEVNPNIAAVTFPAYCAESNDKAFEEVRPTILGLLRGVEKLADGLAGTNAPGYQYWAQLRDTLRERGDDLSYLNDSTPMLMVGDPDFFVERCKKLEDMGITEVVLKLDGFGHSRTMKTIELIGKYVIPEFKAGTGSIPENSFVDMGIPDVGKFEI